MISRSEVKYIQSLYHKKNRDEDAVFIAEGIKIIDELIHSDFIIQKIFALPEWLHIHPGVNNALEVTEAELQKISNFEKEQTKTNRFPRPKRLIGSLDGNQPRSRHNSIPIFV